MQKKEINDIKQFFQEITALLEKKAVYADCTYYHDSSREISLDKTNKEISSGKDAGVRLRAYDGAQFHEYGITGFDKNKIKEAANLLLQSFERKKTDEMIQLTINDQKINQHFESQTEIPTNSIDLSQKIQDTENIMNAILKEKIIVNCRIRYDESTEIRIFVNKYKQLSQKIESCIFIISPYVKTEQGDLRYHYKAFFANGYEARQKISEKEITEIISFTKRIAKADKIAPGKYLCLFTPEVTGLLAHESFGHGMESDTIYKGRAKAQEYLGKRIAADQVNILDNPSFPNRNGSFFFDDEGFITTPTYLVKEGIVNNPITDSFSASRLKMPCSGNARAESYDHKVYARMSNTYFAAGKFKKNEMLKKIKDGLYLHYSSGGMEDPKGWGIQVQGIVAERIKNGKLTGELLYEIGMTGYLPELLNNIQEVSQEFEVPGTGICGKGHKEWVRVSEGGPYLLVKDVNLS